MQTALWLSLAAYFVLIIGVSWWVRRKIKTSEDYIVAGRRLGFGFAWATLLATWFGAGTLMTATDEVYASGFRVTAMEPFGAGFCLILAGLFTAGPLWRMKICTMADFWRIKFGPRAEMFCVVSMFPAFVGWIAIQFVALSGILHAYLGIPMAVGIAVCAVIATAYTVMGGMWSVTLTDAIQLGFIVVGLAILSFAVYGFLGNGDAIEGVRASLAALPGEDKVWIPTSRLPLLLGWVALFMSGAIGNLPGQDLAQRIFASRTARVAQISCVLAGVAYIVLGIIPVGMGLAAKSILPEGTTGAVIPALAKQFLSPAGNVMFMLAAISVILSTVTSAILAPASILARNGLSRVIPQSRISTMRLCQICVVVVAAVSVAVAYSGERAFHLLEKTYSIGLMGFVVPMFMGLWSRRKPSEGAALAALFAGCTVWVIELFVKSEYPLALVGVAASALGYGAYTAYERLTATRLAAGAPVPVGEVEGVTLGLATAAPDAGASQAVPVA